MKKQIVRILVAGSILLACLAVMPGCANLSADQRKAIAADVAVGVVAAGSVAQAFPNKTHLTSDQLAAIQAAAVTAVNTAGNIAATLASPTPTPRTVSP